MNNKPRAVGLKEAAARCGMSHRTARRRVADGTFPVPELRRIGSRDWHRYSELDIDRYLAQNATDDARPLRRVS